jgi:hypothetical protein
MRWRRNADEGLRELERAAAAGDLEAAASAARLRLRTGKATVQWLATAGPVALAALPSELVQALERVVTEYQAAQPDDRLVEGLTVAEVRKRLARYPADTKVMLAINVGELEIPDARSSLAIAQGLYTQVDEVGINHLPRDQFVRLDSWWGPPGA